MKYIFITILLFFAQKVYIKLADKFNITDKPNNRSSHSTITVRGGGIIFPIGALGWFIWSGFQYPYFTIGLSIVSIISFWDDISPLSSRLRFAVHSGAIFLLFSELGLQLFPWWIWIAIGIFCTGVINTFNFMDGINGITGGYSLSVLSGLWLVNNFQIKFISNEFIYFTAISLVVFTFFNFRKSAICFAGDVGSISIAFILTFMLLQLIIKSTNPIYILFIGVYGVDSFLTIIYRLLKHENIFEAHRKHLYQLFANELKIPHVLIASLYSIIQILICILIFYTAKQTSQTAIFLLIGLSISGFLIVIFIGTRYNINKRLDHQQLQNTI